MRKLILGLAALGVAGLAGCGGGSGTSGVSKTSMKIYVQQKLYDKAIAQGMKALASNPNDGDTNYFLGIAYYSKDNELKTESATYADSSEIFLTKAYQFFTKAKEVAAGAWGKSCDDTIVSMFGRHYNRGVIASKKGDNTTAAVEYRLAGIADPENYQGYYAHAAALWPLAMEARNKNDEAKFTELAHAAIKDLDKVLELKPAEKDKIVAVHQTRGEILWKLGQKAESQEAFAKAVELDPENYEMLCTLGERFYNDGDLENAAEYLNSCLSVQERVNAIDASDAETYSVIGSIKTKQGKFDEALASFNQALKLQPESEEATYNVLVTRYKFGDALEKDSKADEAKVQYNEGIKIGSTLIQLNSTKPEYYQVLGYCYRGIGDTARAAIMLKRFNELRQKPN